MPQSSTFDVGMDVHTPLLVCAWHTRAFFRPECAVTGCLEWFWASRPAPMCCSEGGGSPERGHDYEGRHRKVATVHRSWETRESLADRLGKGGPLVVVCEEAR
jgi:hypothetical protein